MNIAATPTVPATPVAPVAPGTTGPAAAGPSGEIGELRRAVGLADLCELLAATFAFPADRGLADSLANGAYLADASGCLADAGLPDSRIRAMCRGLDAFVGSDASTLAQNLRRGHSLLFLSPGSQGPVWPYEGAFRFAATGTSEATSLFRSPVTLQVEKAMGEAGLLPGTARTEPVDSVWGELAFLSQLYGRQAQALALAQGPLAQAPERGAVSPTSDEAARWADRSAAFVRGHVALWMPDFMERARCRAESGVLPYGSEYAALARFGAAAVQVLVGRQ